MSAAVVIPLPGAAAQPVLNRLHRGRWPPRVVSIRYARNRRADVVRVALESQRELAAASLAPCAGLTDPAPVDPHALALVRALQLLGGELAFNMPDEVREEIAALLSALSRTRGGAA